MLAPSESRVSAAEPTADEIIHYRFKIQTGEAPPRIRQPHPFIPRVSKIGLAKMLLGEAFEYGWKLQDEKYQKALLSRPCIYGVFSGRFGGFRPIHKRCTGCMRCVQEFPGICRVDRNPEFTNFPDSYWRMKDSTATSTNPVATVWYEAETGKIPVKGMGYRGPFAGAGWDSIWTDMSEIVRPTRDGVFGREYISTVVDIGRKPRCVKFQDDQVRVQSRTIQIPIPVIFDNLPRNLNSPSITSSIRDASEKTGTLFVADRSFGGSPFHAPSRQMVPLVAASTLSESAQSIPAAKAIEFDYSDVGVLDEIGELNPTAPVIARLPLSKGVESKVLELVASGVDSVHLYANYHGQSFDNDQSIFVGDSIRRVHRALVERGVRDEITIIASGGITLAEHVPKAIICGADLVAIDTTILVALQTRFENECIFAESSHISSTNFDSHWGAQRLVNLLGSWHDQLIEILSAMGMRDVRRLRGDIGRAMFNEDLEKEAFADVPRRA